MTLIRCGFRTKIIEYATGLRMSIVRHLYKEIWGCSPTPGMLPQSVNVVKHAGSGVIENSPRTGTVRTARR